VRLSGEVVSTRNTMQNISRYLKYLKVSQERDGAPDDPKGQGTQCRTAARSLMRELAAAPALLQTPPTFKKNVKKQVKKLRSLSANSQLRRHYSGTPPIRMHYVFQNTGRAGPALCALAPRQRVSRCRRPGHRGGRRRA